MKNLQNSLSNQYKKCSRCGVEKLLSEFHKKAGYKFGVRSECKICIKKWQAEHYADEQIRSKRIKRQREPGYRLSQRKSHLYNKYGITIEDYNKLLTSQNNCCATCQSPNPGGRSAVYFHVDHCHVTGKIRGLLCQACNNVLGLVKDNINTLKAMIKYVN